MKNILFVTLTVSLLGIGSCSQSNQNGKEISFQRSDFKIQKELVGEEITLDDILSYPLQIQLYDSLLLTNNSGTERPFHLFNLNTKHKIGERIQIGQGPKEMTSPRIIEKADSVMFFDMATSTIFTYSIPEFINHPDPELSNRIVLDTKPLWSNLCLLNNAYIAVSYNAVSPCYLFDKTGEKIMNFGKYPASEKKYSDLEIINAFRAEITTNGKDKVVLTHKFTDLIDIYNADGTLELELKGPDHFASVFKEFRDGNIIGSNAVPETYRDAYYNPICVDDKIFVLYKGEYVNSPDYNIRYKEIFVFGWDGSFQAHYTLDRGITNMTVDSKNQIIYGTSDDPEYYLIAFHY